ncbi:MAG: VanZ family protein [Ruminococcus sp.]|nr:VanZ family protein [Ruminococcus sp.]
MDTKKIAVRLAAGLMTLVCMAVIFMFSCDNSDESSDKSGTITRAVISIIAPDYDEMSPAQQQATMDKVEHIIRKLAHFTVYTALGFFSSLTVGRRKLLSKGTAVNMIFCFLYACSDELHQYFVPGRSCQFTDVLIDTSGALTGTLLTMLLFTIIRSRKKLKATK